MVLVKDDIKRLYREYLNASIISAVIVMVISLCYIRKEIRKGD